MAKSHWLISHLAKGRACSSTQSKQFYCPSQFYNNNYRYMKRNALVTISESLGFCNFGLSFLVVEIPKDMFSRNGANTITCLKTSQQPIT